MWLVYCGQHILQWLLGVPLYCCSWYWEMMSVYSDCKNWPTSEVVIVNGCNPCWCWWWTWTLMAGHDEASCIALCIMLEIESTVLEFWNDAVIRSMLLCLDCLAIGNIGLLSWLGCVGVGFQRVIVHSFIFSSLGPWGLCCCCCCCCRHNNWCHHFLHCILLHRIIWQILEMSVQGQGQYGQVVK